MTKCNPHFKSNYSRVTSHDNNWLGKQSFKDLADASRHHGGLRYNVTKSTHTPTAPAERVFFVMNLK